MQSLKVRIEQLGAKRVKDELEQAEAEAKAAGGAKPEVKQPVTRSIKAPNNMTSMEQLDTLIGDLQQLRGELKYAHAFAVNLELQDK